MELYTLLSQTDNIAELQCLLQKYEIIQKSLNILKIKCSDTKFHTLKYTKTFLSAYLFIICPDEYFKNIVFSKLAADVIINTNNKTLEIFATNLEKYRASEKQLLHTEFHFQYNNLKHLQTSNIFLKNGINVQTHLTQLALNYFSK